MRTNLTRNIAGLADCNCAVASCAISYGQARDAAIAAATDTAALRRDTWRDTNEELKARIKGALRKKVQSDCSMRCFIR